jgi:predicted membrane protein DUF2157
MNSQQGHMTRSEPCIELRYLDDGVRDGIITRAQLDALLARAGSEPHYTLEPRRGFNALTVAYWAGAIAVIFALGWFLAARWQQLGAGGVFTVSVVYAAAFAGASRWLIREQYRTAASFMTFLVVATVPVLAWSVMNLIGVWYEPPNAYLHLATDVRLMTRWIPIDIATIVAALIALRLVQFPLLTAAASLGFWYLVLHIAPLIIGAVPRGEKEGWIILIIGVCLLTGGAVIHVRQSRSPSADAAEDYAFWPFLIGLVAIGMATLELWPQHRSVVPHAMLAASLVSVAVSLRIRRREFLVAGAAGFVGYLAWLAFDVFRKTLGFPIVLAGFGLTVILLAVWFQRRYPELLRRLSTDSAAPIAPT